MNVCSRVLHLVHRLERKWQNHDREIARSCARSSRPGIRAARWRRDPATALSPAGVLSSRSRDPRPSHRPDGKTSGCRWKDSLVRTHQSVCIRPRGEQDTRRTGALRRSVRQHAIGRVPAARSDGTLRPRDRGEVVDVSGLDAPYETPASPEILLETVTMTVDENVERILAHLRTARLLP